MAHLHERGYPVPAVDEVSDDGTELVMERIEGSSMVEAIGRAPWHIRRYGRMLAELHLRLHELPAPEFFRASPLGPGRAIVHLDLHPLNVMIGPRGPVVIDWANAAAGDGEVDVALAWALMVSGDIPGNRAKARLFGLARSVLVGSFLAPFDRTLVAARLGAAVDYKANDAHMSGSEIATMRNLVRREGTGPAQDEIG